MAAEFQSTALVPIARPIALPGRSGAQAWLKQIAVILIFIASLTLVSRPISVDAPRLVISPVQMQQWKTQLMPLFQRLHKRDQQALRNLQGSMQDDFIEWKSRVPGFVDDLNGFGSQLGLLGMMAWDGREQTAQAVQATFQEQVVSSVKVRRVMRSHIADLHQQLAENRQEFFIAAGKILDDSHFLTYAKGMLYRQLHVIQKQQLALSGQVAIQVASAPILSVATMNIAQRVAVILLEKLPARLGASLVIKAAKSNWITGIFAFGADYAVSDYLEGEMVAEVQQQIDQNEQTIKQALRAYGINQINADEAILAKVIEQPFAEVNQ